MAKTTDCIDELNASWERHEGNAIVWINPIIGGSGNNSYIDPDLLVPVSGIQDRYEDRFDDTDYYVT